ncbi:MAG: methyltransferase type 12 [Caudoviricetes sp.]|nr:MAG: methyltransferase type 12 [Caudoviricetes sp.]
MKTSTLRSIIMSNKIVDDKPKFYSINPRIILKNGSIISPASFIDDYTEEKIKNYDMFFLLSDELSLTSNPGTYWDGLEIVNRISAISEEDVTIVLKSPTHIRFVNLSDVSQIIVERPS